MSASLGSLMALDALASKKSVRVAAYARAMRTHHRMGADVETVAAAFVDFIGGPSWRLEALDVVLESPTHSLESLLTRAEAIVEWVTREPQPVVIDHRITNETPSPPATATTTQKKKVTRKTN